MEHCPDWALYYWQNIISIEWIVKHKINFVKEKKELNGIAEQLVAEWLELDQINDYVFVYNLGNEEGYKNFKDIYKRKIKFFSDEV